MTRLPAIKPYETDRETKSAKNTFSIEILPPLKGKKHSKYLRQHWSADGIQACFVDVTYHREEYIYKKRDGGYLEKVSIRKRPGTWLAFVRPLWINTTWKPCRTLFWWFYTRRRNWNALIDLQFLVLTMCWRFAATALKPNLLLFRAK